MKDAAANEAYTSWLNGEFAPHADGENWRFFTALAEIKTLQELSGRWLEYKGMLPRDGLSEVKYVADYFQPQH